MATITDIPPDMQRFLKQPTAATGLWWMIGISAILFIASCISGLAALAVFGKAQSVMHEILACLLAMNALGCLCGVGVVEALRAIVNRSN